MFDPRMKATDEKYRTEVEEILKRQQNDNLEHNRHYWNLQVLNWSLTGMAIGLGHEHRMGFRQYVQHVVDLGRGLIQPISEPEEKKEKMKTAEE